MSTSTITTTSKSYDSTKQKCANKDCTSTTLANKLLCGNSSSVCYCSKKCQIEHWPHHKAQCKLHSSPLDSSKAKAIEKARNPSPSPTAVSDRTIMASQCIEKPIPLSNGEKKLQGGIGIWQRRATNCCSIAEGTGTISIATSALQRFVYLLHCIATSRRCG